MKTRLITALLVFTALFTSCKEEKSIDSLKEVKPEVDTHVRVALKVIVKKADDFALFFTEDGTINFFDVKPIWQGVKGSETEQEVTFVLPEDVLPTQLRFDLGLKKDQEDIVIRGLKVTYKGKTFEANGPEFFKYFRPDTNQCTADVNTGVIKAVVANGVRKGPSIYPQETVLGPELAKLVQ